MTISFLISFCNNKKNINNDTGYLGLVTVDTIQKNIEFKNISLRLPDPLKGNGITGLCFHNDNIVLLLQRMPSTLIFLNSQFEFEKHVQLKDIRGVHTILSHDNDLYLSVTNQDKIIKVNNNNEVFTVWSNNTEKDTIHLNSICIHQNQLYGTAFGPKEKNLWSSAQSGFAFNTKSNKKSIEGLWHPHSLQSINNMLYCCDSSNQTVINQNKNALLTLPGYARGLYLDKNLIVCGSSQGRLVSHSTGKKISNKSDNGILAGKCGITVLFRNESKTHFLDLSKYASEIFEVLPL